MNLTQKIVYKTVRGITRLVCRVDDTQLVKVPQQGPLIIVVNHINFLEVPLVGTHLLPRPLTGFAKAEAWKIPLVGWFFSLWNAIPIRRGEADTKALRQGVEALQNGMMMALSPEGTRSRTAQLLPGRPGVVMLALMSGAPILPLIYYGHENLWHDLRRFRRPKFNMVVGEPFYLDARGARVTHEIRQQMLDELMYQLAKLLPPAYRGVYADLDKATMTYLRFPDQNSGDPEKDKTP